MRSGKLRFGIALSCATIILTYCEKQNPVVEDLPRSIDTLKVSPRSALLEVGQSLTITVKGGTKPYSFGSTKSSSYQVISSTDSAIVLSPVDSGRIVINVTDNSSPVQRDSVIISAVAATPSPISEDLFPLVAGRKITFTGFLRSPGADTNITATGSYYQSRWTIGTYNGATAPPVVSSGGTCTQIVDSVRVYPLPSPNGIFVVGSLLIQKAVAQGSADFSFMTSVASFYRSFGLSRIDSLRWIKLTDLASGIGVEFTCYDSMYNVTVPAPTTARLQIVGKFDGTETLTLAGSTFSTYKLTITRRVYLGGSTTPASVSQIASIWFAANIGPVKMILSADDRNYGHYREYVSKNF